MAEYSALTDNRAFSERVLGEVRAALAGRRFAGVRCIAVAGSFGRLEASLASDADFIIVLDDDVVEDRQSAIEAEVVEALAQQFEAFGIERPNPEGVFAKPRSLAELLPAREQGGIGDRHEAFDVMGKRLLLLLESRWLWNEAAYEAVMDAVFERYAWHVIGDQSKEYVYLLNDLIRYFRYICVNYESTFGNQNEKWAIRNIKLRHSRLVMYAGLLVLIGTASRHRDDRKLTIVRDQLRLPPIERLEFAYAEAGDFGFYKVAGLYNAFLLRLSDPSIRTQLNAITYEARYENPTFASIKANSDAFQSELTNFVLRRRGQWSERFFEYLIF